MKGIEIAAAIEAGKQLLAGLPHIQQFKLIGSAMYMPEVNDVDFVVLLDPSQNAVDYTTVLHQSEWGACGEYDGEDGIWAAVRKGGVNLIVTHDADFYGKYVIGMEVCKALKLQHREDRVAVCQIVRDGMSAEEVQTYAQAQAALQDLVPLAEELL